MSDLWLGSIGPLSNAAAQTKTLLDWRVIDAGDAQVHQPMLTELPVLVAIAAEAIAALVVPLVGEANRDSVLAERANLLDQAVVKLAIPLAR